MGITKIKNSIKIFFKQIMHKKIKIHYTNIILASKRFTHACMTSLNCDIKM